MKFFLLSLLYKSIYPISALSFDYYYSVSALALPLGNFCIVIILNKMANLNYHNKPYIL